MLFRQRQPLPGLTVVEKKLKISFPQDNYIVHNGLTEHRFTSNCSCSACEEMVNIEPTPEPKM